MREREGAAGPRPSRSAARGERRHLAPSATAREGEREKKALTCVEAQGYGGGLPEKSPAERARHARGERLPPHAGQPPRGPHPLGSSSAAAEQQLLPFPPPDPWDARVRRRRSLGLRKTQRGAAYLRALHGCAASSVAAAAEPDSGGGGAPARRRVGEEKGLSSLVYVLYRRIGGVYK